MRKLYYTSHTLAERFKPVGVNFSIRYQFDLPCIVGDEDGLKELADKNGMEFHFETHEDEMPPRRRVMSKITDFKDMYEMDAFVNKIDKAIHAGNYRMKRPPGYSIRNASCSFVGDHTLLNLLEFNPNWGENVSIEGKFLRKEDSSLDSSAIVNSNPKEASINFIHPNTSKKLIKDERDPDDVWTIVFNAPSYALGTTYQNLYLQRFEDGSKKLLGMTENKKVIRVI